MRHPQPTITAQRREQIVEAAVAVIAERGLHHLSLSEIEKKAGMSRGQLTYYFPTKEEILLAVFDRVLLLMYQRTSRESGLPAPESLPSPGHCEGGHGSWEKIQLLLEALLTKPPVSKEFHTLQYTFLSQIGYREDFRRKLATLYEGWRANMAGGIDEDLERGTIRRQVDPRAMATLVQAILHGLVMQSAVDPGAFDGETMLSLCLDVLANYLGVEPNTNAKRNGRQRGETVRCRRKRAAAEATTSGGKS